MSQGSGCEQAQFQEKLLPRPSWFRRRDFLRLILIGCLFVAAYALRVYHIKELPLQFHPIRQYRSAFIARSYYYQSLKSVPEGRKRVAELSRQREGTLEPPIMEHIAALAYRLIGKELLWIPRLLSSLFWLVGGAFLYQVAKKLVSRNGALFGAGFFLLLPYGVFASRSFQPDPLMVMMLVVGIYTMLVYHDHPSANRLGLAAVASGLAILIKPMCLFVIFGAFASLAVCRLGFWAAFKNRDSWKFGALALAPSLIFYIYGITVYGGLRAYTMEFFYPRLFLEKTYWEGWLSIIDRVVGTPVFIVALIGVLISAEGRRRALLIGLWSGYFVFGLVFNYYIHTHDYYSLQLIPVVALSLAPVADLFLKRLANMPERRRGWKAARATVLVFATGLTVTSYLQAIWKPLTEIDRDPVQIAQDIGEQVGHSPNTLFLSYANGLIVEYHGDVYGIPWSQESDLRVEKLWNQPALTVEKRFGKIASEYSPEYFIVTDMDAYRQQPELSAFLTRNFSLLAHDDRHLIFDLRKSLPSSPSPEG